MTFSLRASTPVSLALVALPLLVGGCAASAHFYSKTGQEYGAIVKRAVICNESEAEAVARFGGEPIGSISAAGLSINATDDDLAEKAAAVAATRGGTHIVLTERGEDTFSTYHPATREKQCVWSNGIQDCTTTVQSERVTTRSQPTAKFVVLRVPFDRWALLPQSLRPAALD